MLILLGAPVGGPAGPPGLSGPFGLFGPFGPSVARADAVDDALRCLDEQAALEVRQDGMLREAETLGRRIESERVEGRDAPKDLLRRAERLQREALDLQLELLGKRQACRDQASRALPRCEERLRAAEEALASGRGSEAAARELLLLREARGRLQAGVAGPAMLGYPLLPPDSSDTQESLQAKLQYHDEIQGDLRRQAGRVEARVRQVREERRTLAEARRFLEDLSFLDEGGRVAPGGSVTLPGAPGGGAPPNGGAGRTAGGTELGGAAASLELVLGWTPATPEESDRVLRLLEEARAAIANELEAVERTSEEIRRRLAARSAPE